MKLYVIMCPVGPYYKGGFKPVKLYADTAHTRAWPGGVGNVKVGGNYGAALQPAQVAAERHGCSQVRAGASSFTDKCTYSEIICVCLFVCMYVDPMVVRAGPSSD